ncbi:MAG: thioredoxin family protein [Phycisphaeraceae bacterium]|nr:thioredoxin family protein [Phycisphaeraceae bacterium]
MNESQTKPSSSIFTVVSLLVLAVGGVFWLANSQNNTAAEHGQLVPSQLATISSDGVVHLTNWSYDISKAFAQAKTTGKPVLMMVTADWCGPCQKLKKEVLSLPEVDQKIQEGFTPVVWDLTEPTEQEIQQATQWQVTDGIPAMVIFDAEGKPVKRLVGAVPQAKFLQWLGA